jgi:hypothetical protein
VTYEGVRAIGRTLEGVEESTSYGTPALKVRGVLMVRLKEDGETLVLRTTFVDRDLLLNAAPAVYFITDHYRNYPYVLVRLPSITRSELQERMQESWQRLATRTSGREKGDRQKGERRGKT